MSHFDYPYTCPKIDEAIGQAEECIKNHIKDLLEEACPLLDLTFTSMGNYISEKSKSLYEEIEDCFESVRDTNDDMRKAAESQLKSLQAEVDNLRVKIQDLSYELEHQTS